ncbi:MAG: carboxypeptidase-like regulatory domain-containing protein [Bacteroidales bacterium]|nr:carboxypeptidase-like regulatory domain-containing protein [Bacteroidales bacterium]
MKRMIIILLSAMLAVVSGRAQTDSVRLGYAIQGKVVDSRSGRAIESAHVSVPDKHHATVTNADGHFILRSDGPIEAIDVSYIGYKTNRQRNEGSFIVVRLEKENTVLKEASIVYGNPRDIIEAAMQNVWSTYCTEPELLECFYRETLQKGSRYTYVAEAVARLYKHKYDGAVYRDNAALEKSRTLISQKRKDTLSVKTQGGPTLALSMDVVKNSEILFNKDALDCYGYELARSAYIGDRLQFVVKIKPIFEADVPLYYGTVYIDRELLTFTRIELSMDVKDRAKATSVLLVRKPSSLRFVPEEATIVINYALKDGKSRMEYFRSVMRFSCDWRKRLFRTKYTAVNELVITDVRQPVSPIQRKDRFNRSDILSDKASEFFDPDFWADYNIIAPSESLEHAIEKLKRR